MTREEALEVMWKNLPSDKNLPVYEALQTLIPELRESEDERIRAVILKLVLGMRDEIFTTVDKLVTKSKVLAWLGKQKEPDESLEEAAEEYIKKGEISSRSMGCETSLHRRSRMAEKEDNK